MKYACVLFSVLITFFWFGCKRVSNDSIPDGAYAYGSYDSSGTALVRGWFTIIVSDSTAISGEWHFEPIGNPQRIGPQTGDGSLVGGINGEKILDRAESQIQEQQSPA